MGETKIMIVDDEPRIRKLLKDYLAKKEYVVIEASDGEDAVDKFYSINDISLIIMDVMMPKMDGEETLKRIKEDSEGLNKDTPVVVLTANAIAGVREKYIERGFDEYMSKPVEYESIQEMLIKFLPKDKVKLQ
jgi:CheY-like chemotaxis protein